MRGRAALAALTLVLSAREGHTSYHSSVSKSFPGLTVAVAYSDFGDQPGGPPLEEIRGDAEKRLQASAGHVHQLYRHFADGTHRHRRLRALLAADTTKYTGNGVEIHVMADNSMLSAWMHLRAPAAEAVHEKLAFDFALAQLAPGGSAAQAGHEPDDSVGSGLIAYVFFDPNPATVASTVIVVEHLRRREAALRQLAAALDLKDEAARGQWVARAMVAAIDDQPYAPSLFSQLDTFTAEERLHGLKLLVLLLSDARWQTGLAAVRAHAHGDAAFAAWLAPLLPGTRAP